MTQKKTNKGNILRGKSAGKADKQKENGERPPYKKRLNSLPAIRLYLADLIHETRAGKVDPGLAGKLGFLLNVLRGVIYDSDLSERVEKLEKEMEKNEH